jgi:hypothetical protein
VVSTFFGERILGPQRALYLNHRQPPSDYDDGGVPARLATAVPLLPDRPRPTRIAVAVLSAEAFLRTGRRRDAATSIAIERGGRGGRAGPNPLVEALRACRGLRAASRIPSSRLRRGAEAQVSILGGSRTTSERAATSQKGMFVVVDGRWPLPARGPRSP